MVEKEALIKELEAVRVKYRDVFSELVRNQVPGFINPVGLTCNCGESCGTGTSKFDPRLGMVAYRSDKMKRLLNR
jgi:hypothetical protein